MIRVFVLYDEEPDTGQYAEHAELCRRVPGGTFRHGEVFGAPGGHDPAHRYYAEWEFPDRETFPGSGADRRVHGDWQGRPRPRLPPADG